MQHYVKEVVRSVTLAQRLSVLLSHNLEVSCQTPANVVLDRSPVWNMWTAA